MKNETKVRYARVSYCLGGMAGVTHNAYYVQAENQYGQIAEVVLDTGFGSPRVDPNDDEQFEREIVRNCYGINDNHYLSGERYLCATVLDVFAKSNDPLRRHRGLWWAGWSYNPSASPLNQVMSFSEKTFPKDLLSLARDRAKKK